MCKLTAMVNKDNTATTPLQMRILLSIMGENAKLSNKDGTGFNLGGGVGSMWKSSSPMAEVLESDDFKSWMAEVTSHQVFSPIISHVRAATTGKGANKDANSHPFHVGNLILAHNGHFGNYQEMHKLLSLPDEVEVDSHVFLEALVREVGNAPFNPEEHIQPIIDKFEGSFALLIQDIHYAPDTIFAITGTNPLSLYETDQQWILNTDGQLTKEIELLLGINNLYSDNEPDHFVEKTSLKSNTSYTLTTEGLTEIGTIKPNPIKASATTWGAGYTGFHQGNHRNEATVIERQVVGGNSSSDSVTVDFSEMVQIAQARNLVLQKYCITSEMLNSLLGHMLVGDLPDTPAKLNMRTINKLMKFLDYSITKKWFDPDTVQEINMVWSQFEQRLQKLHTKAMPSLVAAKLVDLGDTFVLPFWFNSVGIIHKVYQNSMSDTKVITAAALVH